MKMRKIAMYVLSVVMFTGYASAGEMKDPEPLGFKKGMRPEQFAEKEKRNEFMYSIPIPQQNRRFDKNASVFFSPKSGLAKLTFYGVTTDSSSFGTQLVSVFDSMEKILTNTYGEPSSSHKFVRAGSVWDKPNDFMMGLLREERVHSVFWSFDNFSIHLKLVAGTPSKGYIVLYYEYNNFKEVLEANQKKEAEGF